jgi:hypothetical protein
VLGYPDGGDLATTTARIQKAILLKGPDIYHAGTFSREVYILKGAIGQGDGPVISRDGRMRGIVFGADMDDPDTGFALTATSVDRADVSRRQHETGSHPGLYRVTMSALDLPVTGIARFNV